MPGLKSLDDKEDDLEDTGDDAVDDVPAQEQVTGEAGQDVGAPEVDCPVTTAVEHGQTTDIHLQKGVISIHCIYKVRMSVWQYSLSVCENVSECHCDSVQVCKCAREGMRVDRGFGGNGGMGGGFIYQGVLYNVTEAVEANDDSRNQHQLVVGPLTQKTEKI